MEKINLTLTIDELDMLVNSLAESVLDLARLNAESTDHTEFMEQVFVEYKELFFKLHDLQILVTGEA